MRSTKLAVKSARSRGVGCECAAAACTGTVQLSSRARKVKVGKTRKVVSLTKAVKYSVAAGGSKTVKLALTSQAQGAAEARRSCA